MEIKYLNGFGYWYDNVYKKWFCARIPTFVNPTLKEDTEEEIVKLIKKFTESI